MAGSDSAREVSAVTSLSIRCEFDDLDEERVVIVVDSFKPTEDSLLDSEDDVDGVDMRFFDDEKSFELGNMITTRTKMKRDKISLFSF